MSDTAPTWGYVVVTGLAGLAGGLLIAALLVAGRTPRPAGESSPPIPQPVQPVTVTVTGLPLPPITVTERPPALPAPPPRTTTATVSVTPTVSSPPAPPPTTLGPTTGFFRDER
ncbi:hypothetical protein CU254_40885 [Amycolatopsis sp. AA4]|uniref:hypothetical protein n=1 Tax=Actinomycetes TaxID=1760 RepID=UPI0001B54C25|nr:MULTISPECIES: hypothetical protein [Actinomycetes]ATY16035.1 hypothetical protein CU254_40885 [Amycolatopsis sp. AA4]EFL12385.1 predicted protein [Streptomyces sp. AA4]